MRVNPKRVVRSLLIALDADGRLPLPWIERATSDAPGGLRDSRGLPD